MPKYLDGAGLSHFWESIKPKLGGVAQSGSGTVVTSDDAANLPPLSLTIHGKSVQDGTPSPSNPVEIQSVEPQLVCNVFDHDWSDTSYFTERNAIYTDLGDGWVNITADRTSASSNGSYPFAIKGLDGLVDGDVYSIVIEVRNLVSTIASSKNYISGIWQERQLGTGGASGWAGGYDNVEADYALFRSTTTVVDATNATFLRGRCYVYAGNYLKADFRISVYKGEYGGELLPSDCIGIESGRNLLPAYAFMPSMVGSGVTFTNNNDGTINVNGTANGNAYSGGTLSRSTITPMPILQAGTYVVTPTGLDGCNAYCQLASTLDAAQTSLVVVADEAKSFTIDSPKSIYYRLQVPDGTTITNGTARPAIYAVNAPDEWVPYSTTTTPIPLQGHALRSLPDGTEDTLEVDGEGNVTLTKRIGLTTTATTDGITATVGTDAMSTTGTLADGATVIYKLASEQTISLGTIDLPSMPSPSFSLHVDALVTPTLDAEWFTEGGGKVIDAVSARIAALEADVAELQGQVPDREVLYDTSTWTVIRYGRTVMVQVHGATATPSTSTALITGILADYKPAYNCSATVLTSSGSSTQAARMAVYADTGDVYIVPAGYSSSASWYGTLTYIY